MKIKLNYLLPLFAVIMAGCSKTGTDNNAIPLPTGSFTGQFLRIHKAIDDVKYDTVKATLQLSLSSATGFKITGDTTLHAGSFGAYAVDGLYIQFVDQTASTKLTPAKYHLQGIYDYAYDGTNLTIFASYADTLSFQYRFKKVN